MRERRHERLNPAGVLDLTNQRGCSVGSSTACEFANERLDARWAQSHEQGLGPLGHDVLLITERGDQQPDHFPFRRGPLLRLEQRRHQRHFLLAERTGVAPVNERSCQSAAAASVVQLEQGLHGRSTRLAGRGRQYRHCVGDSF